MASLRTDFYAITFMSYVYIDDPKEIRISNRDELRKRPINEGEVARNIMSCIFICLIQMALVGFALYNLKGGKDFNDSPDCVDLSRSNDYNIDVKGRSNEECAIIKEQILHSFQLVITRLLCALILHLQIEGEIYQAILMMKYTIYRTGGWNRRLPQFSVALMQLVGALATEIINIILIC
jgi:hypothetical protein